MRAKARKRVVPAFASEAAEAEWWYKNRQKIAKDVVEAARKGELKRLTKEELHRRTEASKARVISIRLPEGEIELARLQAAQKALPY
jgi:predicted DNA binding CopG/RHH family protein